MISPTRPDGMRLIKPIPTQRMTITVTEALREITSKDLDELEKHVTVWLIERGVLPITDYPTK